MAKPFLSVVIPSYNEMANLQKGTLDKVKSYLESQKYSYEVIVVDDGSTDGSREFVKDFSKGNTQTHIIENNHTGKAGAVTAGMLAAQGKYVLFTDMDQATPIEELEKMIPHVSKGFEVVIGSRNERRGAPLSRKFMSSANITLRKIIVGLPEINDTQCGFKLFTHEAAQDIFGKVKKIHKGFKTIKGSAVTAGFDLELLLLADNKGYKIKEVPVRWLYVETRRVSPVNDSINGLRDLFQVRYNNNKGQYK
ncbi:MAG TPA: glycosyltransferase [Candidatus Woesebacteria bacterium]|nr:glycosyltransferase [Candidatus Woesebacteria bacterium]